MQSRSQGPDKLQHDARTPARKSPPARAAQPVSPSASRTFTVREPAELLAFLFSQHPGQGRNSVKAMLSRGQVSVGGITVTAFNHPLKPGDTVEIRKGRPPEAVRFVGLSILHEDADVIVIRKEAGLLSVATEEEKELTAYRQLTDYVRKADPRKRIFVLHRLDRDTSGVMMFARSERVQKAMQDNWKDVVTERTYTALVEGQVREPEGKVESWLKENAAMKMYSSPREGEGLHAVTHYRLLRSNRQYSLLEIRLETGRKNQIRVHMQDLGHPIAGDKKYGARTKPIGRLGLHASVLAFVHPTTGETLRFKADIPKSFLSVFKEPESR
ncbi:RluA family pseudouridine synthase [Cohnella sp. CFH 77786]|uniref:RluA family pseudouridine synthase n=1 Tax=Cohnella sp. CFH 77786 TaxID=2662265 RepID=UPI001C609426|nr:RluA family pseudouridine synthase [Cohnella sp. CFH 77786]